MKKWMKIVGVIFLCMVVMVTGGVALRHIIQPERTKSNVQTDEREVVYEDGIHYDVWSEDNYIFYQEQVTLSNTTEYNLKGYILADVSKEQEFIAEAFLYALDENYEKMLVDIPAMTTIELVFILKAQSINGAEALRTDRNPLYDVSFEEVEREKTKD